MKATLTNINAIVLLGLLACAMFLAPYMVRIAYGSASNQNSPQCSNVTHTIVTLGGQFDSTILATSSKRAWATISFPGLATTTAWFSFANGAPAALNVGYMLNGLASSTSLSNMPSFGLNTDLPYQGAVHGLTTVGSTTVIVTQCTFP